MMPLRTSDERRWGQLGHASGLLPGGRVGLFDPPPELVRLSEDQPISELRFDDGRTGWLVSDYELSRAVLSDIRFRAIPLSARRSAVEMGRRMLSQLTEQAVHARCGNVVMIVDERLDAMQAAGPPVDFVQAFAAPVSALVLWDLIGVPARDRATLLATAVAALSPVSDEGGEFEAVDKLSTYARDLVLRKRRDPGNDLVSEWIRGQLSDAELVAGIVGIFVAGHRRTATQFAYGLFTLLHQRVRWNAFKSDLANVGQVVEELVRYLTVIDTIPTRRTATQDVELGGVIVKVGETVVVSALAGNRDARRFANPDTFDPSRDARGHLAFGAGIDVCPGQDIARLQLHVGFTSLARRLPSLRLASTPDQMDWLPDSHELSGPLTLPVAW